MISLVVLFTYPKCLSGHPWETSISCRNGWRRADDCFHFSPLPLEKHMDLQYHAAFRCPFDLHWKNLESLDSIVPL